nr:hypothetical protein CFP56_72891 [Quercus suber]
MVTRAEQGWEPKSFLSFIDLFFYSNICSDWLYRMPTTHRRLFPSSPQRRGLTILTKPITASSSGLEASITDQKGKKIK